MATKHNIFIKKLEKKWKTATNKPAWSVRF